MDSRTLTQLSRVAESPVAADVNCVASYIMIVSGRPMTSMKLHRLCYYAQAWHLVEFDEPLFRNEIQAWMNGPVVPDLYTGHKGRYELTSWDVGDPSQLSADEKETVNIVVEHYGKLSPEQLSELTCVEDPWRLARVGTLPMVRSNVVIPTESMRDYYSQLLHTVHTEK